MCRLMCHVVMVVVATSVYHGCCQSATLAPGNAGVIPRDMDGPTAGHTQDPAQSNEDSRREVARVVSRQRDTMLYWVLVVSGAGLGAIIVLSMLTVIFHKLRRRSHTVDMRHKNSSTGQKAGLHTVIPLTNGHKHTAMADTDRNFSNVTTLALPTTRMADSVLSWGSEFDAAGDVKENLYSNDFKIPLSDRHKMDSTKPANKDIYVNNIL